MRLDWALALTFTLTLSPLLLSGTAHADVVTYESFHGPLSAHGEWVSVGEYGSVWRPSHVVSGWRPYWSGQWQWTDNGWYWQSEEPWGWATYHYGRWVFDPVYGWVWVPGYDWAPAWVSWRYGDVAVGWAPLPPRTSIYVETVPVVYDRWVFVPCNRFHGYRVNEVAYVPTSNAGYWGGTHAAAPIESGGNVHGASPVWGGPPHSFVETQVGHPVSAVPVQTESSPGAHPAGGIYRPAASVVRPDQVNESRGLMPHTNTPITSGTHPTPTEHAPAAVMAHPQPSTPAPRPVNNAPATAPAQHAPTPAPAPVAHSNFAPAHNQPVRTAPPAAHPVTRPTQRPAPAPHPAPARGGGRRR
jgi:hypothetical protein